MGEPVRIVDLAKQMIRLSGFEPETDIAIEIVGRGPARSSTRTSSTPTSARARRPPRRSIGPIATRSIPAWVQTIFDEINLLVLEGDAAALAEHVSKLDSVRVQHTCRRCFADAALEPRRARVST